MIGIVKDGPEAGKPVQWDPQDKHVTGRPIPDAFPWRSNTGRRYTTTEVDECSHWKFPGSVCRHDDLERP